MSRGELNNLSRALFLKFVHDLTQQKGISEYRMLKNAQLPGSLVANIRNGYKKYFSFDVVVLIALANEFPLNIDCRQITVM